jgi:hypothetical protein
MKKLKSIFVIAIAITALFSLTSGCAEEPPAEPGEFEAPGAEPCDTGTTDAENLDDHEFSASYALPLFTVMNTGEGDFKEELVKQITRAKSAGKEDANYRTISEMNIAGLKEIYFPTITFDGYALAYVEISDLTCSYVYMPIEELKGEHYHYSFDTGISIGMRRPEGVDLSDPLGPIWRQADRQGTGALTVDNLVYSPNINDIVAPIGNVWVSIRFPDSMNKYEYLRDLCFELVETAELIVLEK